MNDALRCVSPVDGRVYAERAPADATTVDLALRSAAAAQRHWARIDVEDRCRRLSVAVDAFVSERAAIATELDAIFAAIARPDRIESGLDARLVHTAFARDHHRFSASELRAIRDRAAGEGAVALLTTGKDAVKLEPDDELVSGTLPVYRIDIETELLDSDRLQELLAFATL